MTVTEEPADVVVREGVYGDRVVAVEPGGAEFIPLADRHGRPRQLFWTWCSPNLEFATIFVGVLAVGAFSLGFWGAFLGILVGIPLVFPDGRLLSRRWRWVPALVGVGIGSAAVAAAEPTAEAGAAAQPASQATDGAAVGAGAAQAGVAVLAHLESAAVPFEAVVHAWNEVSVDR